MEKTSFDSTRGRAQEVSRFFDESFFEVANQDRCANCWTQAIDGLGKEFLALALPVRFFGAWAAIDERVRGGLCFLRILGHDLHHSPPLTEQHVGFIHDDTCQLAGETGLFFKLGKVTEGLVKTLLHDIFSILPVPCNPVRRGKCSPFVTGNQLLEGAGISELCSSHQAAFEFLVAAGRRRRFHASAPPLRLQNGLTSAPATVRHESLETRGSGGGLARCGTS